MCVLLNNGDGTFAPAVFYGGGSYPAHIKALDLDADGNVDLVMSNYVSEDVWIYKGDGMGNFTHTGTYSVGNYPAQIVYGDFNNDGIVDLATANTWSNTVSILFGNGDGTFTVSPQYPANQYPHQMQPVDLDGDGSTDLAIPNNGTDYFTVLQNNGDGTFKAPITFTSGGSDIRALAVGDFNGDGKPDIVTSNSDQGTISVFRNTTPFAGIHGLVSYWPGDDNALDVISGNNGTPHDGVTYVPAVVNDGFEIDGNAGGINVADADTLKLTKSITITAWVNTFGYPPGPSHDWGMIYFRGDDRSGYDPYWLAVGPDGNIRFVVENNANQGAEVIAPIPLNQWVFVKASIDDATGMMYLWLNGQLVSLNHTWIRAFHDLDPNSNPGIGIGNHGGWPNTFHNFPFYGIIDELKVYNTAVTPVPGDFNGDGLQDVLLQNVTTGELATWYMNGSKALGGSYITPVQSPSWRAVGIADFSGKRQSDILFQNMTTGRLVIWYMNGAQAVDGTYVVPGQSPTWKAVGIGDFSGNGHPDILFQNVSTGQMAVWFMSGNTATGAAYVTPSQNPAWTAVGVADFNGDSKADILFQNASTGQLAVWYMNGTKASDGVLIKPTQNPNWQAAAVGDYNGDGHPDILFQNKNSGQMAVWFMTGVTVKDATYLSATPPQGWKVAGSP